MMNRERFTRRRRLRPGKGWWPSPTAGPCALRAGPIPKQLMQSRDGGILRLGGFSLLVNGCLGDLCKSLVGRLFLFECFLQKSDGVVETELFGPSYERAVA
jgi:hypothetical protein